MTTAAPGRLAPYVRLFSAPGALAFTAGNLLARLPMGMFTVATVMMIAAERGSYALAGAVTAVGLAATALVAPLTARLVDRHGQARVAVPATLCAAAGSVALVLCVRSGAPDWTLFACYAATATTPNTGGMSRARWAYLYAGDAHARHTANAFEQAADELCFLLGPLLAAFLCASVAPEAGTLTGVVLLVTGMTLFAAQRRTEPPVSVREAGTAARSPLRLPGMPGLLAVFACVGVVFGSLEVVTVAHADAAGQASAAGWVLALQAGGSALAGLWFGTLRPSGSPSRRLAACAAAMAAVMTLPLLAAAGGGGLLVLGAAMLLAGVATAPTMVTGMALVQQTVPVARLNEGMTLAVTAILTGIAAGSATGGWTAEHLGGPAAYALPPAAAALAACAAWAAVPFRGSSHEKQDSDILNP